MKWYVYKDNGNGTYQLILDHNTTATVAWNSSGSNSNMKEVQTKLTEDTNTWDSSLKARLITADEVAQITGNTSFSGASSTYDKWFYLDSNSQTQVANATTKSNYAWLYDYTKECISFGCNIEDNSNYGYWISTTVSGNTNNAWDVCSYGKLNYYYVTSNSGSGVRPVITV